MIRPHQICITLLVVLVGLSFGCLRKPETVKLSQPTPIVTSYVLTFADRPDVAPAPDELGETIEAALGKRNLQPQSTTDEELTTAFERKRATQDRLALLAVRAAAEERPFVMLVETTARYYSLLNGRFRWNVNVKATIAPTDRLDEAQSQSWELAAFLDFDHQDEFDALVYQAGPIADRVGRITDQFLTGLDTADVQRPKKKSQKPTTKPPSGSAQGPLAPGSAIYFVMVDRFHNGEPGNDVDADPSDPQAFHGGDLQGLEAKLDWIEGLGVTTIWLSPIFEMRDTKFHGHGAFHGYWVDDITRVEDRFGGEKALKSLRQSMEKREMSLMLDLVVNHVGMDTTLVKKKPDWFHNKGGITDWDDREQILTHDVHGLPDLAVEKPEVYKHLATSSLAWIREVDPGGFRLDAVKHVPYSFWTKFNADIKARAGPDFVLLGEDLDGDPARVARTMREGRFDAMFDFPLHFALVDVFCRDAHPGRLASILYADRLYPDTVGTRRQGLVTLLDNHDLPRVLSACGNEVDRVQDAARFMLSARGTPSITWGTESGALGAQEPDNRADMRFVDHPVGETLRRWLALRKNNNVFTHGSDRLLSLDDEHFAYLRTTDGQSAVVAFNRGAPRPITIPGVANVQWTNLATDVASTTLRAAPGVTIWVADSSVKVPAAGDVTVSFEIDDAPTPDVRVVGSGPELGNWNPFDAPTVGEVTLPGGSAFAYKFVAIGEEGAIFWENGDNRYVLAESGATLQAKFRR